MAGLSDRRWFIYYNSCENSDSVSAAASSSLLLSLVVKVTYLKSVVNTEQLIKMIF